MEGNKENDFDVYVLNFVRYYTCVCKEFVRLMQSRC